MTLTEFLEDVEFKPYASVVNSWDSFGPDGEVMMQLWDSPCTRVRDPSFPERYLRLRCFDIEHFKANGSNHRVGYNGRTSAIQRIENSARGFAVISTAPNSARGAGIWARYADLTKCYPILTIDREACGDIYVIVGKPVPVKAINPITQ